jgi:hypothetical protein
MRSSALAAALLLAAPAALAQAAPPAKSVEEVKANAQQALGELPPAPGEQAGAQADGSLLGAQGAPAPATEAFGQNGRPSGREAAELQLEAPPGDACPEGFAPVLQEGQPLPGLDGRPACKQKRPFIKGELTNLGATKLKLKDSRFGIRLGYARLDGSSYLSVTPEADLAFGRLSFGLGVPLNLRAYANGFLDGGGLHLRTNDYSSPSSYARILRFLTYGAKEDNLYLNVSQLFAATIGHGAIVRRYSGNIDQNITRVGAQLDAYGRYGGFEAFIGDIVDPTHFMSGVLFVKPLGFLSGPLLATLGQTSLGLSAAADLEAPFTLRRGPVSSDPSIPSGFPQVGDDGEPVVAVQRQAKVVGGDLETKVLKTEQSDVKLFADYSRMLGIQDEAGKELPSGGGFTLGALGRFNAGEVKPHAFRAIVEGRYFDGNYIPGYFDTFYEVQKYQYITGRADTSYDTKLKAFLTRDPAQKRLGFYAEFGWQYNQGLAVMLAYEDSFQVQGPTCVGAGVTPGPGQKSCSYDPGVGTRNLTLHIEYPVYSWLQFFASFYRRSFGGAPIDWSHPLGDNTLVYSAARLHLLPILFLNLRYYRSWQADPVLGEMKNVPGFEADLEFGYEFDRSAKK